MNQEPRRTIHLAEGGDVKAMVRLGVSYSMAKGGGTAPCEDRREALKWLRKAGEKGDFEAIFFLGISLAETREESQMWLKRGAELGSKACMVELSNRYIWGTNGFTQDYGAGIYWELRRSETDMKASGWDNQRIARELLGGEKTLRQQYAYHGPIRPLP